MTGKECFGYGVTVFHLAPECLLGFVAPEAFGDWPQVASPVFLCLVSVCFVLGRLPSLSSHHIACDLGILKCAHAIFFAHRTELRPALGW